jgi:hypothetical protein
MHSKSFFGRDKNTASGFAGTCRTVVKARNSSAHLRARDQNNLRHKVNRRRQRASVDAALWAMKKLVSDARRRAAARGYEFNLDAAKMERPATCPVFGWRLVYQAERRRKPNSASLDRIDSSRGYTTDNVWVISWRANMLKSDASAAELRAVADALDALKPDIGDEVPA